MKRIQVLGTGCPKCKKLQEAVQKAATEAGIAFELEKVTDIQRIIEFGVMSTPALVVDGQVKVMGRIPTEDEIKQLLK